VTDNPSRFHIIFGASVGFGLGLLIMLFEDLTFGSHKRNIGVLRTLVHLIPRSAEEP
jgi:hypothetical protein